MRTVLFRLAVCAMLVIFSMPLWSQTCVPTVCYTLANGDTTSYVSGAQSAPVHAAYKANPQQTEGRITVYEWRLYNVDEGIDNPIEHRYEENFEYTFERHGKFGVQLQAWFIEGTDTIKYPEPGEKNPFLIEISDSKLVMPNAFSPNGDGVNDEYKPVEYQSIISFKASIFNRWGQKIYSWNDINGFWDGKVNGKVVQDGVYFINVEAKGADGNVFHIRQDINVLTRYTNE